MDTFSNKYTAILLSADGKTASMLRDKTGKNLVFIRPLISWISKDPQLSADNQIESRTKEISPPENGNFKSNPLMSFKRSSNNNPNFDKAYDDFAGATKATGLTQAPWPTR